MLPEYITKIEGHGVLNIHFKECRARLEVTEGERLFEAVLLGQDVSRAPFITSRICGVCPTAHNLASIRAIENGLNIQVDETIMDLRKLLLSGQIIFSHLLHLFFLVLPDYYQVPSALDIAEKFPAEYHLALNLKRLSDKLLTTIGGRPIHPTTTMIGGFLKLPDKGELITLKDDIEDVLDEAQDLIKIFQNISYPQIQRPSEYLILSGKDYAVLGETVLSSSKDQFSVQDYKSEIKEEIKPYSTAKFGRRRNRTINVGALPRMAMMKDRLNPRAKALAENFNPQPSTHNPFDNIKAQALEIMHFLEEGSSVIDKLLNAKLPQTPTKITLPKPAKPVWAIGAIEAPRGTLYHAYEIDTHGKIINCDIVTPTVQNLTSLEEDAETLLRELQLDQKEPKICIKELEMLIRAYDPCITCSVH
ncbi:MAG TPA: nickel-dependent hydrogenase large subunit [Patescibacteria group bacterium]|nr:nickel-dependent hydrogenase large subunit [Patescibacteria group bacterium]